MSNMPSCEKEAGTGREGGGREVEATGEDRKQREKEEREDKKKGQKEEEDNEKYRI